MEGVCSPQTRALIADYAPVGVVCAPFIRVTDQRPSAEWLRAQVRRERVRNLSMQLLGRHAAHLAYAAQVLCSEGVGIIDLNFGCPSRQVMRKGAGSALLSDRETIGRIVSEVRQVTTSTLSVKIRGGVDDLTETLAIARTIEQAGADVLVLHPRSGRQGYDGVADWSWVRRVKAQLGIPVVGNGDCWYANVALRLMRWSGCDAVMIGRPCLRNPWIFRQVGELVRGQAPMIPTGHDVLVHLFRLAQSLEQELGVGPVRAIGALKEHARYLLRAVPESHRAAISARVLRASTRADLLAAMSPIEAIEGLDLEASSECPLEPVPFADSW